MSLEAEHKIMKNFEGVKQNGYKNNLDNKTKINQKRSYKNTKCNPNQPNGNKGNKGINSINSKNDIAGRVASIVNNFEEVNEFRRSR